MSYSLEWLIEDRVILLKIGAVIDLEQIEQACDILPAASYGASEVVEPASS